MAGQTVEIAASRAHLTRVANQIEIVCLVEGHNWTFGQISRRFRLSHATAIAEYKRGVDYLRRENERLAMADEQR